MGRSKTNHTNTEYNKIQADIKRSSLQDHKDWVEDCAAELQDANDVGDTRKMYDSGWDYEAVRVVVTSHAGSVWSRLC